MKQLITLLLISISSLVSGQGKKPFVLGVIDELNSEILSEKRILNIYLPEGYSATDTIKYPVIYLLDGSADEDFIHVAGLVQFNNFPWIDRVPKSIVVGIANIDRKRDFSYPTSVAGDKAIMPTSGGSDKFITFLESELQPFIEKNYKAGNSKTIIGQSLGGLLASEVLLKKTTLFNNYIIISPSVWWDNGSLLKLKSAILEQNFKQKTQVYIGVGKEGPAPGVIKRLMEDDAKLLYNKIRATNSKNVSVYFDYLPQEDHATITHQAVFNAFRLLYPAKITGM
jgi:predicted alpha/beta superfamily hydrolase